MREIILVKSKQPFKKNPSVLEETKRIIYLDPETFELKGEIVWTKEDKCYPQVKKVNDSSFDIVDCRHRTYRFIPKDEKTVDDWISLINNTPPI